MVLRLKTVDNKINSSSNKADDENLSKKLKNIKFGIQTHIKAIKKPIFLTLSVKKTFNQLKQIFIKTLILWYLDPKYHIQIKNNASSYTIKRVFSQLTFDNLISNHNSK